MNTDNALLIDDQPQKLSADLRKFNKAEAQVTKTVAELSAIVKIETPEQVQQAMEKLKLAKTVENLIENKRVDLVKPWNEEVKKINNYAKTLVARLPPAIMAAKQKVLDYQKAEEEKMLNRRFEVRTAQLTGIGLTENAQGAWVSANTYLLPDMIRKTDDISWTQVVSKIVSDIETARLKKLADLQKDNDLLQAFGSDEEKAEVKKEIEKVSAPVQKVDSNLPAYFPQAEKVKGVTKTWTFEITDPLQVPREFLIVDETKIRKAIAEGARTISGVNIFQKDGLTIR